MGKRGPKPGSKRWWDPQRGPGQKKRPLSPAREQSQKNVSAGEELQKEVSSAEQLQKEVSSAELLLQQRLRAVEELQNEVWVSRAAEEAGGEEAEQCVVTRKPGPPRGSKRWWDPQLGRGQTKPPGLSPARECRGCGRTRPLGRGRCDQLAKLQGTCGNYPF